MIYNLYFVKLICFSSSILLATYFDFVAKLINASFLMEESSHGGRLIFKEDEHGNPIRLLPDNRTNFEELDYNNLSYSNERKIKYTEDGNNSMRLRDFGVDSTLFSSRKNNTINIQPTFIQQPTDTFIIKSSPAKLSCRVSSAFDVYFQCNSVIIKPWRKVDFVEPESGLKFTDADVLIQRDQVDEFFGDFHCACVASSPQGSIISKLASVSVAYLKKQFEVPPYSQQIARGLQVQFRCLGPRGRPRPKISWEANGHQVEGSNFIVTVEGHLIIVAARISDSGTYICVAQNVAGKRRSQPATLNVYVDGGWSSWSNFGACSGGCEKRTKQRSRSCTNPKPVNGGQICLGPTVHKKVCDRQISCNKNVIKEKDLVSDGGWTEWTLWSSCNPECFQHRRRTCTNPPPSSRGIYCLGLNLETLNCSHGFCQSKRKKVVYNVSPSDVSIDSVDVSNQISPRSKDSLKGDKDINSDDVYLYIVFGVCLVVLATVMVGIIRVVRSIKLTHDNGYVLASTEYGYGGISIEGGKKSNNDSLGSEVCLSKTPSYGYVYKSQESINADQVMHHYEQPMVSLVPERNDLARNPSRSEVCTTSQISPLSSMGGELGLFASNPSTSTPIPELPSPYSSRPVVTVVPSFTSNINHINMCSQLSSNLNFTTWGTITNAGMKICIPETGVYFTVPPGALILSKYKENTFLDVFVSVVYDAFKPNQLKSSETLLSPIVRIGPSSIIDKLSKPFIITFPHCSRPSVKDWKINIQHQYESMPSSNASIWNKIDSFIGDGGNTLVHLDEKDCHVISGKPGYFTMTGESVNLGQATKRLCLVAFIQSEAVTISEITIRVYCLPDNQDALLFVTQLERKFNWHRLNNSVSINFKASKYPERPGENLFLSLENINLPWTCQEDAKCQEIPFQHVWNNTNLNLHCSFTLKRKRQQRLSINHKELSLVIQVFQNKKEFKETPKLLQIHTNLDHCQCIKEILEKTDQTIGIDERYYRTMRLSGEIVILLSQLLDPHQSLSNWRHLAIGLEMKVDLIARYCQVSEFSPTQIILGLWEAKSVENDAVEKLIALFQKISRYDAVSILKQFG